MRICICCGKDLDVLGKNKKAIYCSRLCKQRTLTRRNYHKILERNREWYLQNKEERLQQCSQYYKQLSWEQLEHKKEISRKSYHKNKHTGKVNNNTAKRRSAKLQRTPKWLTEFDIFYIEELYRLAKLRTISTGILFEVDHRLPLQGKTLCGLHVPDNLCLLSRFENRSKGNRL